MCGQTQFWNNAQFTCQCWVSKLAQPVETWKGPIRPLANAIYPPSVGFDLDLRHWSILVYCGPLPLGYLYECGWGTLVKPRPGNSKHASNIKNHTPQIFYEMHQKKTKMYAGNMYDNKNQICLSSVYWHMYQLEVDSDKSITKKSCFGCLLDRVEVGKIPPPPKHKYKDESDVTTYLIETRMQKY